MTEHQTAQTTAASMPGDKRRTQSRSRAEVHGGMRTCVGCGERVPVDKRDRSMFRVVFVPGDGDEMTAVADLSGSNLGPARGRFGRGAWIHARRACLDKAVRKGFSRAAKAKVSTPAATLAEQVALQAHRRAESLVGAARRAGKLAIGAQAVREMMPGDDAAATEPRGGPTVVVAVDAEAAARSNEVARAFAHGLALAWGTKRSLGDLLGRAEVGVIAIADEGIADALRHAVGLVETFGTAR